jgi:hypothetical protein
VVDGCSFLFIEFAQIHRIASIAGIPPQHVREAHRYKATAFDEPHEPGIRNRGLWHETHDRKREFPDAPE